MSATATSGQREHDKHSAALKSSAMFSEQNEGLCPPAPLTETGAEDGPPLLGRASRSHILSLRSSETATGATWENPQLALRIRRPDLEAESREPACTQEPGPSRPGAGLSTGFSRQEYWSGLPSPSPGNLPNPGTEHRSPALQADS